VRVAELICELTGWVEQARMTVSGTEATMHAMRVARAHTGRDKIVKFEGQYHGVHDYALISVLPDDVGELGDRDNPVRLAWGRGIPQAVMETVIPAPYDDLAFLRRVLEREGDAVAGVLIEPILGNAQAIRPSEGFLQGVRDLTREFGCLLIFDEVKTGFRLAKGGAAQYFGIKPDLAAYAKAMGNGYPAAAFGGSREIMSVMPEQMSHGGTFAGNRVAAAAAVATLTILRDTNALETIRATGEAIQRGMGDVLRRRGVAHVFTGHPSMFGVMFTETLPTDYRGWANTNHELYDTVALGMIARGAMPEPDSREPWFLSESHTSEDVGNICEIFEASLSAALH
jgi:glutamate-1-semialdehyde 2,1-aminomutase